MRPCVRVLFPDDISETVSRIAFILHTDIPEGMYMCLLGVMTFDLIFGVDVPFGGYDLWPIFFTFDFEAIIDLKWLRIISSVSGRHLANRFLDCFHTAHTNPSGGVYVPFGGYDLCPNFLPWLLTLIDYRWKFTFRTISRKAFAELFSYCTHTSLRECTCAFWGLWPLT